MDFGFSEEQEMLKTMARDYLTKNCPKPADMYKKQGTDEKGYPEELWKGMAELGWLGLAFPEKYGGAGGKFTDLTVVLEEMGWAALPGPFFSTVVLGGMTVLEAGSEEQKQELLGKISQGEIILTLALPETDNYSYSPADVKMQATPTKGGYILNGTKVFVPNAHVADYIICAARTSKGVTLFLVDGKNPGLKKTVLQTIDWSKQFMVEFNGVKVPESSVLGKAGDGEKALEKALARAKVGICADSVGCAAHALDMALNYAKERVQFGVHIGSFEVIQHYCADMAIALEASRWATYRSAWAIDEGLPYTQWVAMAKAFTSKAVQEITFTSTHVHGSIGMTMDHDMPMFYVRAKANELSYGTTDENLELVAKELKL